MTGVDVRDVLVVGTGHIGLVTALALAREGLTVEVLDTGARARLPWTAVHHWSVLAGLDELDVLGDVLRQGHPTTGWGLRVLATGEQLAFDLRELRSEVPFPFNVRIEEPRLCAVLEEALLGHGTVSLRRNVRVRSVLQHDAGVVVEVEDLTGDRTELVRARWVVAADGVASAVRREVGLGYEGVTWPERSVVALVEHDFGAHGYADTTFQVDGRLGAVVERADECRWRYVYEEPLTLSEEGIADRMPDVLRRATGADPRVLDWTSDRMHLRSAASYRAGRVLLVGEAAHVTHRLVGRTSTSAYFDAFSLGPVLSGVLRGDLDADVLDRWAQARRRTFHDEVVPTTSAGKNLVTQIRDLRRLAVELDQFRRAVSDAGLRRELLLQGRELEGSPVGLAAGS